MKETGRNSQKKLRKMGVPQIPEDVHRTLQRGMEPTQEQEERAAKAIAEACRMIRGIITVRLCVC